MFGSLKPSEIQAVSLQFLACSHIWTTMDSSLHMSCQTTNLSVLTPLCQPATAPTNSTREIPNTLKVNTIVRLILVFKRAQVEQTIPPGQLGFKEPHWAAAKILHTAPIATAYSEIMIQTMQQVSKEYRGPLSQCFLLSSINTYTL